MRAAQDLQRIDRQDGLQVGGQPFRRRFRQAAVDLFHQLLEHRWFMAQQAGHDIPLAEAVTSYVNQVLRHRRDEATVLGPPTGSTSTIEVVPETSAIAVVDPDDENDWRLKV